MIKLKYPHLQFEYSARGNNKNELYKFDKALIYEFNKFLNDQCIEPERYQGKLSSEESAANDHLANQLFLFQNLDFSDNVDNCNKNLDRDEPDYDHVYGTDHTIPEKIMERIRLI